MPETKITDVKSLLPWEEASKHRDALKDIAAHQFLAIWNAQRERQDNELRWGEEIEYMLVDLQGGTAKVALCADEVLRRLGPDSGGSDPTTSAGWRTEYGNMMVEGVTLPPFSWSLDDILLIEPSLSWRRREVERVAAEVNPNVRVVTMAAFPLLGVPGSTVPASAPSPEGNISQSVLCADEVTSPHPRYQTLTANYRKRKGCKVGAFIPRESIRDEERIPPGMVERLPFELSRKKVSSTDPVPGHIYMDSQAFGACQCCTQATFLTRNLEDARHLTDQLLVLAPLFMALSAATPFLRGLVAETDTRWETFQQCWDDRSEAELSSVRNSRCSACDLFIGGALLSPDAKEVVANDVEVPVHQPSIKLLTDAGVDGLLSRHVAHILVRDPILVVEGSLSSDGGAETNYWEQIQGTNWGSVRFKPPPADGSIGWRVEFRTPEVQLTDYENAALVAVVRVLVQVIMEERWNLVIPISLCDANDRTSGQRNAASQAKFWFPQPLAEGQSENTVREATQQPLSEILSGAQGIFTRCRLWLLQRQQSGACSSEALAKLEGYMSLFERRAKGELPTPAGFLRARLQRHPDYRGDGVLPAAFVHDLCSFAAELSRGGVEGTSELLGI